MNDYILTVGLEIHAELKTRTKMFCDSRNDADETRPNVNVCPVCMGHPGTLPVINKEAIQHVLKVGLALGGQLAHFTEFDRKNYFYPDIPKGYQLSQYEFPLVVGGSLCGVATTRVHLEEDTATSRHFSLRSDEVQPLSRFEVEPQEKSGFSDYSLLDFNRAGVPLMELVTEPVIHSAKDAGNFARELQLLLRYLGASDANMEKGEMRVEANISVKLKVESEKQKNTALGTKVEVKNLNSFRAVEKAIEYEYARQTTLLESGGKVLQETRGWDEMTGKTFGQRHKEESQDYRYFPDPDLPKLMIRDVPAFELKRLQNEMPELPGARRARFKALDIKAEDAETLVGNRSLADLFEKAIAAFTREEVLLAANYVTSDLIGLIKKAKADADCMPFAFTPQAFAELIGMVRKGKLSSRGAKDILQVLFEKGGNPETIANEQGLLQKSDAGELQKIVKEIIAQNAKVAEDYRNGKTVALQFLLGQGMKATKGAANPAVLREVFVSLLK